MTKRRMFVWIGIVTVLELHLSEQTARKLQEAAEHFSISPEQLSILSIEEKLTQLEVEFHRSAQYALKKNADLYQRLSLRATYLIKTSLDWTNSLAVASDVLPPQLQSQSRQFNRAY